MGTNHNNSQTSHHNETNPFNPINQTCHHRTSQTNLTSLHKTSQTNQVCPHKTSQTNQVRPHRTSQANQACPHRTSQINPISHNSQTIQACHHSPTNQQIAQ